MNMYDNSSTGLIVIKISCYTFHRILTLKAWFRNIIIATFPLKPKKHRQGKHN